MMNNKKLTIISEAFAPKMVGSPVLLNNLFEEYKGPLSAIAGWPYGALIDKSFTPACPTSYIKWPLNILQRVHDRFKLKFLFLDRILIKWHLKRHQTNVALVVCPGGEFFVAGCQACLELKIPYFVHMHDLWSDNLTEDSSIRLFADVWEPRVLRGAKKVFAMTNIQKDYLDKKYGIDCIVLPHTIPTNRINEWRPFSTSKLTREEKIIVYTGNISHMMNLDAIQQFVLAVNLLPSNFKVKMFISFDKETRIKNKIESDRIEYNWLSRDEVFDEIKNANAVFLPLSFKNAAMDEVRTVFATKTLDYLISGVPIVVFSPKDSFHSISALNRKWGHVVSKDDIHLLAEKIVELVIDGELSQQLVKSSLDEANSRRSAIFADFLLKQVNSI